MSLRLRLRRLPICFGRLSCRSFLVGVHGILWVPGDGARDVAVPAASFLRLSIPSECVPLTVTKPQPVLILGAGINGCALARELVLNGVPVVLVDQADISSGATAYSSRLIHGGLRYLEHGELDLVRESLAERTRLLRLAPQFVQPLQLFIPVSNRFGGVLQSAARFLRLRERAATKSRGLWLVRTGLWMYDTYARDRSLPKHRVYRNGDPAAIAVDAAHYPWVCAYYDAQIGLTERFVVALLEDARRLAEEQGVELRVLTYHRATRERDTVRIVPVDVARGAEDASNATASSERYTIRPSVIVNATGAWVDKTLEQLQIDSRPLMGGTKGSHFFTRHRPLVARLAGRGLYGEADDGRPVFVLPLAGGALVGTTDLPFEGDPADAVASEEELRYLLRLVNQVLPDVGLTRGDIDWHYSGVRPLPATGGDTPASITRRHWMEPHEDSEPAVYSVIGGKLTTCRALAEEEVATLLPKLGMPVRRTSVDRWIPGGEGYPRDESQRESLLAELAASSGWPRDAVHAIWTLCGTRAGEILTSLQHESPAPIAGTPLPRAYVRWVIEHEWVRRLDDLVERRLMLLYHPRLSEAALRELAELLVETGRLDAGKVDEEIARVRVRLADHFGKQVEP